jgi:glucuronoarabinoxylan endo-1,4-beta-xylanase
LGIVFVACAGPCDINLGESHQTIDGFGFSSAWCGTLSAAKNNALYNTLGMSLLRIRIDENGNWGEETANSKAAHAVGVKVLGSPWSPPPSWNTNGKNGGGHLLPQHYGDYVNWLRNASQHIGLDWVSIQNEPDYQSWTNWTPTEIFNFMKNNAGGIGTPVVMPESFHFNDQISDPVINDAVAETHFSILGGHLYGGGLSVHQNALNHGKRVWMTEHYIDNTQTSMANCLTIAKEISDCMNDQMSAYFWWWVYEASTTNLVTNTGSIFKNGYTIGQFAKWVRPGSVRVTTTYSPNTNVYVTAYKNNAGVVIVAINTGNSAVNQQFTLQGTSNTKSFNIHRTTQNENMASVGNVNVENNSFTYSLNPQSVTTFHP